MTAYTQSEIIKALRGYKIPIHEAARDDAHNQAISNPSFWMAILAKPLTRAEISKRARERKADSKQKELRHVLIPILSEERENELKIKIRAVRLVER